MIRRLFLNVRDATARAGLTGAAEQLGLEVAALSDDPAAVVSAVGPETALRAPGGLLAAAVRAGAAVRLAGPTPQWFVRLDPEMTGRRWSMSNPAKAREMLVTGPALIKLADAKRRDLPARRYRSVADLDAALASSGQVGDLQLLATTTWLSIVSEYRVFTRGREVLASSPYSIEDEPWTPLLRTHRASMHDEAGEYVRTVLDTLDSSQVPPAAALDVARLDDGRFVLLEANQGWSAALYGCDPGRVLLAVLAANAPNAPGQRDQWLWRPDPALTGPDTAGRRGPPGSELAGIPTPDGPPRSTSGAGQLKSGSAGD